MKNKNEKVNSFSLSILVITLSGAPFWGILTSYLLYNSKEATPISMLIGYFLGLIISKIFLSFNDTHKDLISSKKIEKIYSKFSIVINIIEAILAIFTYIFLCYRLSSFLSSQYLIETPDIYFFILILALTFYIADQGIETLTRVTIISIYVAITIFVFDYINLFKEINFNNFLPILTVNFKSIIKSSIIYALFSSVPPMFAMSISKTDIIDHENFNKMYYRMYSISFIILLIAITTTIGVYGINLSSLFDYPLYTVLKKIEIFSFIDSIENISVILWILYSINAASAVLLSIFNNLKEALNLDKKKTKYFKALTMLLILIITIFFYKKNSYIETIEYIKYPIYVTFILFMLTFISLIISKIKSRKKS